MPVAEKVVKFAGVPITDALGISFNRIVAGTFMMSSPDEYQSFLLIDRLPASAAKILCNSVL